MECKETDNKDIADESLEWKTGRRRSNTGSMQFSGEPSRFLDHRHRSASGQPAAAAAAAEERPLEAAASRTVIFQQSDGASADSVPRRSGTFSRALKADELSDAASLCVASVLLTFLSEFWLSASRAMLEFRRVFEHNPIIHFGCRYISLPQRSHVG